MSLTWSPDYAPVDGDFDSVSLLLKGEGTNASTTILDSSSNNLSVTAVDNAQIINTVATPFSPAVPSDGVLAFDGTGDYLQVAESNSNLTFGTGDFTVEFFIYRNTLKTSIFLDWREFTGFQGDRLTFYIPTNQQLVLFGIYPTGSFLSLNFTPSINTWYHCALSRTGGTLRFFVDGIQTYSGSNPNNYLGPQSSSGIYIGGVGFATGFGENCYLSNFRITKGVSRYTENFDVPTAPFPIYSPTTRAQA